MVKCLDNVVQDAIDDAIINSNVLFVLKYGHVETVIVREPYGLRYFKSVLCNSDVVEICDIIDRCKFGRTNTYPDVSTNRVTASFFEGLFCQGTCFAFWITFVDNKCDISYLDLVCRLDDSINNYRLLTNIIRHLQKTNVITNWSLKYAVKQYFYKRED